MLTFLIRPNLTDFALKVLILYTGFLRSIMGNISASGKHIPFSSKAISNQLTKVDDSSVSSIWKDPVGNMFEQYKVNLAKTKELEEQLHIYQLRKYKNFNLVAVHSVQFATKKSLSFGYQELRVFAQRILFTLSQTSTITTQQGLSILFQAAVGFECLYKHAGYFQINDYLIGFNDNRQIRVWLNTDWSSNSKMANNYKQPFGDIEHIMVVRMIEVVEMHIQKSPFFGMFIERRKCIQSWTFRKLIQFIEKFTTQKKFKLTKSCHLNIDILKTKTQFRQTKQAFNFKVKSKSPKYQHSIDKHSIIKNSLVSHVDKIKPEKNCSQENYDLGKKATVVNRVKLPQCINFKSNRELTNITNQISFTTRLDNKQVRFREKRNSQYVTTEIPKNNLFIKHRRLSSHSIQYTNERKQLAISARETFKLHSSKGLDSNQKNNSLQKIRKQLRGFLGGLTQDDMRTSCPGLALDDALCNSLRQSLNPAELQFKSLQKKIIQKHQTKTQQDDSVGCGSFSLQFGFKKSKLKKLGNASLPFSKQESFRSISFNNRLLNTQTLEVNKLHPLESPNDQTIRSTLPNPKSIEHSMLAKTASRDGQSSMTMFSKARELKQSQVIPQDIEQGNISQRNLQSRFVGFNSLKLKNTLTQSINIPAPAQTEKKTSDQSNGKKPLSMLDIMVIKRNLMKQKKNEEELDVSVEVIDETLVLSNKMKQHQSK